MAIKWTTEETKTTTKEWWLQTQWSNVGATPSAGNHRTTREDLFAACEASGISIGCECGGDVCDAGARLRKAETLLSAALRATRSDPPLVNVQRIPHGVPHAGGPCLRTGIREHLAEVGK